MAEIRSRSHSLESHSNDSPADPPQLITTSSKRVLLAKPEELKAPAIAWPTVFLFLFGAFSFYYPIIKDWEHPSIRHVPLAAIGLYALFTTGHDSAHRSIAPRNRFLNDLIGHISIFAYGGPFEAFRHVHLQHHKHTNVSGKDPDLWSSSHHFWWVLPFCWITQVPYYYFWYISDAYEHRRNLCVVIRCVTIQASILIALACLYIYGYGAQANCFFVFPILLSQGFTAFSFDYVPHKPHTVSRDENIYRTTNQVSGLLFKEDGVNLSWLLLYQNYHNIHHLYPTVPFYRMARIWQNHEQELLGLGTPQVSYLGGVDDFEKGNDAKAVPS